MEHCHVPDTGQRFTCLNLPNPRNHPTSGNYYHPTFPGEETEAQRDWVTCPRDKHTQERTGLLSEPKVGAEILTRMPAYIYPVCCMVLQGHFFNGCIIESKIRKVHEGLWNTLKTGHSDLGWGKKTNKVLSFHHNYDAATFSNSNFSLMPVNLVGVISIM